MAELSAFMEAREARARAEMGIGKEPDAPSEIGATDERLKRALDDGGYARVTLLSQRTGKHLTIELRAKRRGGDGRFVSRARKEGRVGLGDADALFVDDSRGEWVATYHPGTGEWRSGTSQDARNGLWAARKVVAWALGGPAPEGAEVLMSLSCSVCGRALTDPQSIERGMGPECFGRSTGSKHA